MSDARVDPARLVEEALANGGSVKLATLVAGLVPVQELRAIGKRFDLSPKGHRIERAPAERIAPLLAESTDAEVLDAVVAAVVDRFGQELESSGDGASSQASAAMAARLALKDQDLARSRSDLDRQREQAQNLRERVAELQRHLDVESESSARIRSLEEENEDLRSRVPKHRRKKEPPPPPPPLPEEFRVPHLLPSLYKSFDGKERRAVEAAMRAILVFCTEGPTYPGLEVKQIEGQDLWSLRASLKLRVYFRLRGDGDVDFVALADREDQHTTLRRLKDR